MGEEEGEEVEWKGNVLTAHVGTDARILNDLLVGVAGSQSSGSYDFTDKIGSREVAGTYEPRMTSVNPYLALLPGPIGVAVWTAGSLGWGRVTISDEIEGARQNEVQIKAGGMGASRILLSSASSALRLRAEGWFSRLDLTGTEEMDSLTLQMRRARAALEWSQEYTLDNGGEVHFLAEGGMRYGEGERTEGIKMEIGGGLRYMSPSRKVTMEGYARNLVADGSGYEELGLRGLIQIVLQGEDRGLTFRLRPVWGSASSRVQELWEGSLQARQADGRAGPRGRLDAEVEFGLPAFDGTPYGNLRIADGGTHEFGTGLRYAVSRVLDLRVEGTHTGRPEGPGHLGITAKGRWQF